MTNKFARAIADNPGETESELVFKTGDLIKVISEETGSDGWWEGELNGKIGYFPASFVTYDTDASDDYDDYDGGDASSAAADTVVRDKTGRVTFDYEPTGDDDMKAKTGDVIKFAEIPDSPEWVDAELNGVTGYIPKSYIEEISGNDGMPVAVKSESAAGDKASSHLSPSVAAALTPPPAPTKKRPKTFYMGSNDIFKIDSEYKWKCQVPPATITLSVCEKKAGGIKKFTTYKLTSDKTGKSVERRYNNFLWLNQRLSEQFPLIALPYLPEKQMSGRFDSLFLGYRSRQLERYINYCTHHPILGSCELVKFFLETPEEWKAHKENEYQFVMRVQTEKPVNPTEATSTISGFKGYASAHRKAIRSLGEAMQDLTDKLRASTGEYEKLIEKLTSMQSEKCWTPECQLCGGLSSKFSDIIEIYKAEMSYLSPESKILHISEAADRFEFNTEAFYRLEKRIESAETAMLKKPNEITTENVSRARAIMLAELEMFHENQTEDFTQALVSTAKSEYEYHKKIGDMWLTFIQKCEQQKK